MRRRDARARQTPKRKGRESDPSRRERGFTLIELLIVITVLPLVVGAISAGLLSVFSLQGGVSSRVSDSDDAQLVSANFVKDVQSAAYLTTDASSTSPAPCGTGTQLLGLEWGGGATEVSYDLSQVGTTTTYNLVRNLCQGSTTPTTSGVVSHDMSSSQSPPTVAQLSGVVSFPSVGWVTTASVTIVKFNITEPGSNYAYSLVALPGASGPAGGSSSFASSDNTSCGFATAGTGTYASTLCFVDFSSFVQPSSGCEQMTAGITNTPYTLSFCLTTSTASNSSPYGAVANGITAVAFPTYFSPPTSEAFLGNNGFYTGVPGKPALYENTEGTTATITVTNIQVTDSNGTSATGWQLVTGDAESTDSGESITWTASSDLSLLPNSPSSPYGNACAEPAQTSGVYLTGLGTTSVECAATVSSDKTGTVMLEAPTPTSLTSVLYGTGLQAIFIGLLLP